ncbi:MAG TPA: tetratricopeptide repeat protein, partial [Longimicrobiales bacterium]
FAAADSLLRRALAIASATFGDDAPEVAGLLEELAALRRLQGDEAAARRLDDEALAIRRN